MQPRGILYGGGHPDLRKIESDRQKTKKRECDWSGIRTHASEETSALNWRLRPLGHPTESGARVDPMPRSRNYDLCDVPERGTAPVAQLAARGSHNPKVASSILAGSTSFFAALPDVPPSSVGRAQDF